MPATCPLRKVTSPTMVGRVVALEFGFVTASRITTEPRRAFVKLPENADDVVEEEEEEEDALFPPGEFVAAAAAASPWGGLL